MPLNKWIMHSLLQYAFEEMDSALSATDSFKQTYKTAQHSVLAFEGIDTINKFAFCEWFDDHSICPSSCEFGNI